MNQFVPVGISLGSVGSELAEVAERLRRCTVEVCGLSAGKGSGVIWRSDGLIMTNAHVATSPPHTVRLDDGRVFKAELIGRNPRYDLAALQIAATALPSAQSRPANSLRTGEVVLAVGNPMGIAGAFTVGVVSSTPKPDDVLVRADIRLAPGNSGGPLADAYGRVVGINSMIVEGFGMAVTSTAVVRFLEGNRRRIGVTVQPVAVRGTTQSALGLTVVELEPGGAAHLSGVLIGDVIIRVNGKTLNSLAELSDAIKAATHAVLLDLLRAGRRESCEVTLRERSAEVA